MQFPRLAVRRITAPLCYHTHRPARFRRWGRVPQTSLSISRAFIQHLSGSTVLADRVDLFLPDVQYMTEAAYIRYGPRSLPLFGPRWLLLDLACNYSLLFTTARLCNAHTHALCRRSVWWPFVSVQRAPQPLSCVCRLLPRGMRCGASRSLISRLFNPVQHGNVQLGTPIYNLSLIHI